VYSTWSDRVNDKSACEERICKPVRIGKEKKRLAKKQLESDKFQNDCHSISNFSEPAEMDQAVSVTRDRINGSIRLYLQIRNMQVERIRFFFDEV